MKNVYLLFIVLFSANIVLAQIIPDNRKINWKPGLTEGIPDISSPVKNVLDFGADSSGINDSYDAFAQALQSLPAAGGVIYMPKGKYLLRSGIEINRDNIVFRGDGHKKTKLLMNFNGDCFSVITYKRGEWQSIGEINKGVKTIVVPDGTKFSVGQFAEIQQENDPDVMYTKPDWNVSWAENSVGQLFEIEKIIGDSITFKTEVHIDFSADLNPVIRPQGFVRNIGFENFYIEKMVAGGNTFKFKNALIVGLII